jgi:hypothetical protein
MTAPTITGTPQVGQTLTVSIGDIQPPVAYQWNRAGTPISGATSATYVPGAADVGNKITVTVVTVSPPTAAVIDIIPTNSILPTISGTAQLPVNTALPTIGGTAQIGQTLSASTGGWTNSPTSFAYQWSDSATGPIGGATARAYVPTSANLGHKLTVSVVAANAVGPSTPATSAATSVVIDIIPTNTVVPLISNGGILDFSQASNSGLISALAA